MKKRIVFPIALLTISFLSIDAFAEENICTSREMLYSAIQSAKDNDTIYVGDIDFTPEGNIFNSVMRLDLSKSVTLKNGKKKGEAVFTNGSFNIKGGKISGTSLNVSFEGITFDGNIEGNKLTDADWEYADPEDLEPRKCQYAMNFVGNVNASYKDCIFKNYMNEYGGAFWARYGDYTGELEEWFGNYSTCLLDISLDECKVLDNYAMYGGGALYFEGTSKNISFHASNTEFIGNKSACTNFSEGGGAFRLNSVDADFINCLFSDNEGSYSYGSTPRTGVDPEEYCWYTDRTYGGAIRAEASSLELIECTFNDNMACCGGALHLGMTSAVIDGCVFYENKANSNLLMETKEESDKGPWSNMGMGGAIYIDSSSKIPVDIYNSSFYKNEARNGYASVYGYYLAGASELQPDVFPIVNIYLSSFYDNKVLMEYTNDSDHPWAEVPGDVLTIPYFTYDSCFVVDDTLKSDFPRYETPSVENNYCYYASPSKLVSDSIVVSYDLENKHILLDSSKVDLTIPKEHIDSILRDRYSGEAPVHYSVGSNYSYSYFHNVEKKSSSFNPIYVIIPVVSLAVASVIVLVIVLLIRQKRKKNASPDVQEEVIALESEVAFNEQEVSSMLESSSELDSLTSREKEILEGILKGKKRKEIADELFVSEATIKKYTTSI